MAGCFTNEDGDPQLVGPGEETTMTTKNEDIEFIILDSDESFSDVEPNKSKAIAWHPDKGERWWGF